MNPIEIKINHDPVAWTSPKLGRGFCYSTHSKYKEIFQSIIRAQYKSCPLRGYVKLDFVFEFPYPKSSTKKNILLMQVERILPTKCDLSNCVKFAEDCLKKIVIEDDRNVVQITSKKLYGLTGSVIIKVTPCE
jgi:Holliday junction resolvase RusA-like endonuclease